MPDVRQAIRWVEREFQIQRLLLDAGLRAAPGKMFLKRYSELIDLAPSGQHVIERAFGHHLEAVVQDPKGVPIKLYPWIPDPTAGPKRTVLIDPNVSFGLPITASRGIATAVLTAQVDAGATLEELVEDYGLSTEAIEDALAFERAAA